jgi:hypothetical protein
MSPRVAGHSHYRGRGTIAQRGAAGAAPAVPTRGLAAANHACRPWGRLRHGPLCHPGGPSPPDPHNFRRPSADRLTAGFHIRKGPPEPAESPQLPADLGGPAHRRFHVRKGLGTPQPLVTVGRPGSPLAFTSADSQASAGLGGLWKAPGQRPFSVHYAVGAPPCCVRPTAPRPTAPNRRRPPSASRCRGCLLPGHGATIPKTPARGGRYVVVAPTTTKECRGGAHHDKRSRGTHVLTGASDPAITVAPTRRPEVPNDPEYRRRVVVGFPCGRRWPFCRTAG